MFQRAVTMQELAAMRQKKEEKLRRNKKKLSVYEIVTKRMKITAAHNERAHSIVMSVGIQP